ncbi:MAG TPA: transporter, partial [Candidatus Sulfotelmatobacter sp.]|nr:transporter [Candidatus Sulfotelmatobacter sp.]
NAMSGVLSEVKKDDAGYSSAAGVLRLNEQRNRRPGDLIDNKKMQRAFALGCALICAALVTLAAPAAAQDLEPRAYSASPTGANFLVVGFGRSSGEIIFDPSVQVTDVQAEIYSPVFGLGRTFGVFGRQALITAALPYAFGNVEGKVGPQLQQQEITRSGLADLRLKFSINLRGGPALSPREFAQAKHRGFLIGASLAVQAPTGQYGPTKLINLGTNRWALRPEMGVSYPWKKFYFDLYAGAWFFTKNASFFPGASVKRQDPLTGLQAHVSYTLRPKLWFALDSTWYGGGDASVDGGRSTGRQNNTRLGVTCSIPVAKNQSVKVAYSDGVTARVGTRFRSVAVSWQFLWFDRQSKH